MDFIKKIDRIISSLEISNTPIMRKPEDSELKDHWRGISGLDSLDTSYTNKEDLMRTDDSIHHERVWLMPEEVDSKLKPDTEYKVWYYYSDRTGTRRVYYIEEVNPARKRLIRYLKRVLKELE